MGKIQEKDTYDLTEDIINQEYQPFVCSVNLQFLEHDFCPKNKHEGVLNYKLWERYKKRTHKVKM